MDIFELVVAVFLGLVFGSFATALSYRLPRDISMITRGRSHCHACHHTLGVRDLVPLLSWMALRGRCRYCRAAIGWRYPLIELATLALCLVFYTVYGFQPETFLIFLLAPVLISIIDIDLHYKIIPDSLNLSILLTGVAAFGVNAFLDGDVLDTGAEAAAGVMAYGLGSWALRNGMMWVMKREPMGLGDVKFFAAAGFWLGLDATMAAAFMMISGLSGIVLALLWKRRTGEAEFPFGPSLIVAFIVILCFYRPVFIG